MQAKTEMSVRYANAVAALRTTLLGSPVRNVRDLRQDYWSENISSLRSLQILLRRTKRHSVTDPRDKVYGLLGMMSDIFMDVDFNKSVSKVYCEATTLPALESPPALFVDMMYSRPVLGISDDVYFRLWKDTSIPNGIVFRGVSAVHCDPKSLELKVSASTVDLISRIIECPDNLITDAQSDDQALQLLKYLAELQEFYDSYTKAASMWNTQAHEGMFGIIKQRPNMDATLTQQECAENYAALISVNEEEAVSVYEDSEPLSSLLYEFFIMR
jgi:hypothetical protein